MIRFAFPLIASLLLAPPLLAAEDFVLEDAVATCAGCHGEADERVPADPEFPVLYGQQFFYIYTQLKDYAAGRREHEVMTPIAAEYDKDQMKALAQYFSEQEWPKIAAATEEGDDALAQKGIAGGQCSACHGKWEGDSRIPRLAGQQQAYLQKTMEDFKHEVRMNAPDKISTMKQLSDETIAALSRYLSAL